MGTSTGGIVIRTSKSIDETSKFCFGDGLTKTSYCDTRQSNCFYFGRKEGLIAIINSDFSNKLFSQNRIDDALFNFFEKPEEIFVFEEYDSGASYGYAIFQNGQLIRKLRTENYNDITDEDGMPLKEELQWLTGQKITGSDGETLIKNAVSGHETNDVLLYKEILQLLMINRFSFTCETMDDEFTESGCYIKTGQSESNGQVNKKWWKFW